MAPVRWIICWAKTASAKVPAFCRESGGSPGAYRRLALRQKYTSGVLSFAEQNLPPGQREKLMASFERVLMPGLDKDQYSVLWVEHRDKGRLELNFLIPNTELLTGRRLQPYYDRADRPRIDARQTIVNGRLGLHDRTRRRTGGRWSCRPRCRKLSRKPLRRLRGVCWP